jgi:hypothetical protein
MGSILEGLIAAMERPLLNNACIEVALRRPVRQPEACSKSARIRLSERVKLSRQRTLPSDTGVNIRPEATRE